MRNDEGIAIMGDDSDSNELGDRECQVTGIQHGRRISDSERLPIRHVLYAKLLYFLSTGR